MAHYAIGDLQGCYDELETLLAKIGFNHGSDTLWLTGDIVNRGPKSLECLQFAKRHESSVRTVLGNHDLHLLAVSYGYGKIKRGDTIEPILKHPARRQLLDWLHQQPLLITDNNYLLVHAGLLPQWSVADAIALAAEVENELRSPNPSAYFAEMYGNKPRSWNPKLSEAERLRMITNVMTRMRAISYNNELDYDFKGNPADMPAGLRAWFEAPDRRHLSHTIIFGHWSALGYLDACRVISLDTGALWGGALTAVDLNTRRIQQVDSIDDINWKK